MMMTGFHFLGVNYPFKNTSSRSESATAILTVVCLLVGCTRRFLRSKYCSKWCSLSSGIHSWYILCI